MITWFKISISWTSYCGIWGILWQSKSMRFIQFRKWKCLPANFILVKLQIHPFLLEYRKKTIVVHPCLMPLSSIWEVEIYASNADCQLNLNILMMTSNLGLSKPFNKIRSRLDKIGQNNILKKDSVQVVNNDVLPS